MRNWKNDEEENDDEKKVKENIDFLTAKMLKSRNILLSGEIEKNLAEKTIKTLLLMDEHSNEPIKVFIDSPGGDLHAGYAIYDMMKFVSSPVYTIGMGLVASAGALILLASPIEKRLALQNSAYLIHQPLIGGVMRGVATDIEIQAIELEKAKEKLNKLIAKETETDLDKVKKDTERDYWMDSLEALSYNLVSKILQTKKELEDIIKSNE